MKGGCLREDVPFALAAGAEHGDVQEFDGTRLLFFHLKTPPHQLLSHINVLEEPFETLVASRSHPIAAPPFSECTSGREDEIKQLMTPENVCKWNFDLFRLRALAGEHTF